MRARRRAVQAAAFLLTGCLAPAPRTVTVTPPVDRMAPPPTIQDAGWQFPIARGVLPVEPELLPNAERGYRGGIHQGVDLFYARQDGELLACGERVLNARTGTVTRADKDWPEMTVKEYENTTTRLKAVPDEARLDRLRGRQVWVSCDDGVLIRYCHLMAIDPSIDVGLKIAHGIVIGQIGNSGTADGAAVTGKGCHLHFEVWPTPDAYLGKGLSAREARKAYARLFGME